MRELFLSACLREKALSLARERLAQRALDSLSLPLPSRGAFSFPFSLGLLAEGSVAAHEQGILLLVDEALSQQATRALLHAFLHLREGLCLCVDISVNVLRVRGRALRLDVRSADGGARSTAIEGGR